MNKERVLALADVIEKQPHVGAYAKEGFSMTTYSHPCGTPSCIGGFAAHQAGFTNWSDIDAVFDAAMEWLDITHRDADNLFEPLMCWSFITPSMAAWTLRNLAKTGEVMWQEDEP